uniref:BHLH domain-containing protein n=1 Tax=Chenopodium quinoa TaxID=63459 RepID=A0A803MSX6_CHEQI
MKGAGGLLKTHTFLQPLEGEEKSGTKEDNLVDIDVKPPSAAPPTSVVEYVLPGGIGTYSISHISYFNPRVPKPEENIFLVASATSNDKNDDNSNCSSYTGSGFTLWDESTVKKGNKEKENLGDENIVKGFLYITYLPVLRLIRSRFHMLRELIPYSDQKRDKASFLLEVIEYIQYLQEKVNRYEGAYPGWNSEPPKLNPLRNSHGATESFVDQSRAVNASPVLMFGAKVDEKATPDVSLNVPCNPQTPSRM